MSGDEPDREPGAAEPAQPTVDINYIKSRDFREIGCDGVIGGPTPTSKLWLAFFTERLPLPRIVRYNLVQSGQEGEFSVDPAQPGAPVEAREGVVRNVEFGVYLSIESAEQLRDWLGRNIDALKGEAK